MSGIYKTLSFTIKAMEAIHPEIAANFTFKLFQKTRKLPIKKREKIFYRNAHTLFLKSPMGVIPCYEMGNPSHPLVILVHGWESNAGSLAGIANIVVKKGFRVLAIDLPAHGKFKGKRTNLIECKNVLRWVIDHKVEEATPFHVISHSFGSAVAAFALSNSAYQVQQFIMLSTFNRVEQIFLDYKNMLRIPDGVYDRFYQKAMNLVQLPVNQLSVAAQLQAVDYHKLTIIHDTNDKVIPISYAHEVVNNTPHSQLILLKRVGHYRMLWSEKTYMQIRQLLEPILK